MSILSGVFTTLSNIYDGVFSWKIAIAFYLLTKSQKSFVVDVWKSPKYTSITRSTGDAIK